MIEPRLIDGRNVGPESFRSGQQRRYRKTATVLAMVLDGPGVVDTPEGRMAFSEGDYLVTDDPPTHAWPVRREVFERTHEAIPVEPSAGETDPTAETGL